METANTSTGAYSVKELALRVGSSEKAIWKWFYNNRLPGAIRCGRIVRFDRATIERRILGGELLLPVVSGNR